jgi:hypothetical protein
VDSKYGSLRGGWCSLESTSAFGVGVWKNIRKCWISFSRFTRFVVGMAPRSVFGMICGVETTLKVAFLALFSIARVKDAVVADNLELLGDSFQWNVSFNREAHDWEVDVFVSFFQLLHSVKVNRDNEDSLWWVSSEKGVFKVKSFFYSLTSAGSSHFPWKSVWRTQALPRAAFFVWTVAFGKILTQDNLRKRHVIVINRCCMCKKTEEAIDHLLLHWDVSSVLWNSLFSRFGMSWVIPRRVIDLLACWWSSSRSRSAAVWKMATICIFWCLWSERNNRSFEDLERSLEEILSLLYHSLYCWTSAFVYHLYISFSNFLTPFSISR